MNRLLYWFSCLLMVLMIGCGGTEYWTYTTVETPAHITHPTYIPVWVDSSFSLRQVEEIQAALKEWNYVLNGHIVLYLQTKRALGTDKQMHDYPSSFVGWDNGKALAKQSEKTGLGWVIYNLPSTDSHYNKQVGPEVLAYVTGPDTHEVFVISDRFGTRSWKDILMHEFAHLLGAMHVNAPSLENPTYSSNSYPCIDKITVAQVAQHQGLPMYQLNYCVTPNFE